MSETLQREFAYPFEIMPFIYALIMSTKGNYNETHKLIQEGIAIYEKHPQNRICDLRGNANGKNSILQENVLQQNRQNLPLVFSTRKSKDINKIKSKDVTKVLIGILKIVFVIRLVILEPKQKKHHHCMRINNQEKIRENTMLLFHYRKKFIALHIGHTAYKINRLILELIS